MIATNVDLEELLMVLLKMNRAGIKYMNLEMTQDENHPEMNKLIIHPVRFSRKEKEKGMERPDGTGSYGSSEDTINDNISNPKINLEGDDIFNIFDKI